jgi:hypothetical protein
LIIIIITITTTTTIKIIISVLTIVITVIMIIIAITIMKIILMLSRYVGPNQQCNALLKVKTLSVENQHNRRMRKGCKRCSAHTLHHT